MLDKEQLLKPRLPEAEVQLPGLGVVRVRGLSRAETVHMGKLAVDGDLDASETWLVACGMVDPALDEHEARDWRKAAPGDELTPVVDTILELSGLTEDAQKTTERTLALGETDPFRVRPGPGPGPDTDRGAPDG
jgi:hypothetical protein